jgi:hypothetical protein
MYLIAGTLPHMLDIYSLRSLRGTPELNKKYNAFARDDFKHWSYWKLPLTAMLTGFPIRFIIGVSIKIIYITVAYFAFIGCDP